ncbi:toxin HicA [Scrofimicrobium sp. R131]|uniref:Toxin HicA n=1 Tax=Scrofimicrobium appendicitidis TaxID=3079930 RepID=A0AAU7V7J0_9ACTO
MTKRKDLLSIIRKYAKEQGLELVVKEGGSHTWVWVGEKYATLPRHNEIPNRFAHTILRQLGVEE